VLIDDVYTTGATLNAAARAIKAHWPVQVSALVFAHTPPR
jgi:predicted amidophosphoribosyltransferase